MPESSLLRKITNGRGRAIRSLPILHILLLSTILPFIACGEDEREVDPLLEYVRSAGSLILDSGMSEETLLRGDSLHAFMNEFERDSFTPGPRSVRIESDCHPGSLTIGRRSYPVALCTVWSGPHRPVMAIDLDSVVVRLIEP